MKDEDIRSYLYGKNGRLISYRLKHISNEMSAYLCIRYADSLTLNEALYRFQYNIEQRPVCEICGKQVEFKLRGNLGSYDKYCSDECRSKGRLNNIRETNKILYNDENYNNRTDAKNTCLKKYGVDNPSKNDEIKSKISLANKKPKIIDNRTPQQKHKDTCLRLHGDSNYRNVEKHKQTCLNKYGVDSTNKVKEIRDKFVNTFTSYEVQKQRNETLNKNKTRKKSTIEIKIKEWLDKEHINYIYQYMSYEYPFCCDFYFPDNNLYVEIQGTWTHGRHPYDPNDENDNIIIEQWKSKKTKFYDNAIETWTIRDVKKREIGKKLNWIEIFSIDFDKCKTIIEKHLKTI